MKNYRLKKEAVPFFKEKHACSIYDLDTWNKLQVDESALEEVESPYLKFGHENKRDDQIASSWLSGWNENGTHFNFTIFYPSVKYNEHDKFSGGKSTRELMDKIQNCINKYYENFVNF